MVNAALKHAASMTVRANDHAIGPNSVVDELSIFGRKTVQTLLDDMVPVQILNQFHDMIFQRTDDGLGLFRGGDELDHFLESSGTMLVQCNLHELGSGIIDQSSSLLVIGVLQKFLAEVVAEGVSHELHNVNMSFVEDQLDVFWGTLLELPLQIPAAMLILTKAVQLTLVMLEGVVGKARQLGRFAVPVPTGCSTLGWTFRQAVVAVGGKTAVRWGGRIVLHLAVHRRLIIHVRWHAISIERVLEGGERSRRHGASTRGGRGQLGTKGRSIGLQGGLGGPGSVQFGFLPLRRILLLTGVHCIHRDAAQTGIVMVELLSMGFGGCDGRVEAIALDRREIIGRVGRLERHGAAGGRGDHAILASLTTVEDVVLKGMSGSMTRSIGRVGLILVLHTEHVQRVLRHALMGRPVAIVRVPSLRVGSTGIGQVKGNRVGGQLQVQSVSCRAQSIR